MNAYYDHRRLNRMLGELVSWLQLREPEQLRQNMAAWDTADWQTMQLAILMQGVGPYLHVTLPETAVYPQLPPFLQTWLAEQYDMNRQRLQRMRAELAEIVQQTRQAGIPLMPLKGSILAWQYYPQPWLRPMADLDILIRPADRQGMIAILQRLGYCFDPGDSNEHAQHMVFKNPGAAVVSLSGEHPDNPRPVEVHWALRKGAWGDISSCDFTEQMWATATETAEGTWQPTVTVLAEYVAFHASYHLLFRSGRLIHLLDLALLSGELRPFTPTYPNWMYPALQLTARALPHLFHFDLTPLRALTHPRVVAWADDVPLDGRCGLSSALPPHLVPRARLHWNRWWPSVWRLRLGYYHLPLPLAYAQHFREWGVRLWHKSRTRRQPESLFRP
ncbi:MAG: nucleotidyltransferase family protein [Anaerolineales bacterium]|nr:nucleotidyltransferase family protein [Anaerolineales bacterium]